jgi:hypothetical protein
MAASNFFQLINNRFKFNLFLFSKLPSAYCSGVRVQHASEEKCIVTVPFKWFSQNPFKSTYFACLSMAAEMSTGVLGLAHIHGRKPGVSMLVVNIKGDFMKKAVGKTTFTCNDGIAIKQTIESAIATGEGKTITAKSTGVNEQGEVVAVFEVTWSFKGKKN